MPKTKISEFSSTPANNTDIDSINIAEGCAPSGINDAIRELMAQLKDFQVGSAGDPVTVGGVLTVTAGAVGTPAITTAGDTNTGIFFPAADTIAFAEGGAEVARFDSSANFSVQGAISSTISSKTAEFNAAGGSIYASFNDGTKTWRTGVGIFAAGQFSIRNATDSLQAIDITSAGNVGIGTSSPGTKLDVSGNLRFSAANPAIEFNNGGAQVYSTVANTLQFASGGGIGSATERMRIDSSGNLLVGKTTVQTTSRIETLATAGTNNGVGVYSATTSTTGSVVFFNPNGQVGTISTNGSATTYATSSDYRLKNTIASMTGALDKVALLKPVTYKWNVDGSDGQGFIAHELQEVIEGCVTGEKDAVDAEGNPQYQGIDTSFLVATLTAAIQEQQALIQSLTDRITALEAA
jgi:hypothetical protein